MMKSHHFDFDEYEIEYETDQWFGTKYHTERFPIRLINKMNYPIVDEKKQKLGIPAKNYLIPTNFEILPRNEEYSQKPCLLKQWENTDLWYMKDDTFTKPITVISFKLYSNDCGYGNDMKTDLFIKVWKHVVTYYLRELMFMGTKANIQVEIQTNQNNLNFLFSGFSECMPDYVNQFIGKML